jgi:hypothetical protein
MRRRCAAHDQWMRAHPDGSAFSVYNDIPSEPTAIVVPVFDTEPDTGFGVDLGQNDWTAPGLVTSVRKGSSMACRRNRPPASVDRSLSVCVQP